MAERAARRVARESARNLLLLPNEQLDPFGQRREDNVNGRRQWEGFFMQSSSVCCWAAQSATAQTETLNKYSIPTAGNFAKL
jgi:hypothetical protein